MGRWIAFVGLIGFGFLGLSGYAERQILYPFDATYVTPQAAGLSDITEHRLETPDGETLIMWLAQPRAGRPVLVYFHGNAGNLGHRATRFRAFQQEGYGILAPAYRGASGSTGTTSQEYLESDAELIFAALPELFSETTVVVYGESLGAAVAIYLAGRVSPDALVLEAPFTSVADLLLLHYPQFGSLATRLRNPWPSLERIAEVTTPTLMLHGTDDTLIPIEMSRRLLDASGASDIRLVEVPNAGHNSTWRPPGRRALFGFLNRF